MFTSRVERTISAAHHNGPVGNKCRNNHGHDWKIAVLYQYGLNKLNRYGWGHDFSEIKHALDDILGTLDHQDLNSVFDTRFTGHPPSAEWLAVFIYQEMSDSGMKPWGVEIEEGKGNSVVYIPSHD